MRLTDLIQALAESLGFAPELRGAEEVAAYLSRYTGNPNSVDPEQIENYLGRGCQFILKQVPLAWIKPDSNQDHHIRVGSRIQAYKRLDPTTMPPVLVRKNGTLIDGHHRLEVAKAKKLNTIPAYVYQGDILDEALTRHKIHINPSTQAFRNLVDMSQNHIVKGLYDPQTHTLFVGLGFYYTHSDIESELEDQGYRPRQYIPFVVARSIIDPQRYGVVFCESNYDSLYRSRYPSTNFPHEEIKKIPFFRLPQIARLNWADVSDSSWRKNWT